MKQSSHRKTSVIAASISILMLLFGCDTGTPVDDEGTGPFGSDAAVFTFVTQTDPYSAYSLFPHADSVTSGTLNGSTAHQPMVRVSMNAIALSSLNAGRFPSSGSFRDSSVILKEIRNSANQTTLLAVVVKQTGHSNAGNGWLWAEFQPDGTPVYTTKNKGTGCTGCHSLEQGPQHDFIRTFERQLP